MLVGLVWIELLVLLFAGIDFVWFSNFSPEFAGIGLVIWFGFPTFLGFAGIGLVWFSNFSPECRQPLETERTSQLIRVKHKKSKTARDKD